MYHRTEPYDESLEEECQSHRLAKPSGVVSKNNSVLRPRVKSPEAKESFIRKFSNKNVSLDKRKLLNDSINFKTKPDKLETHNLNIQIPYEYLTDIFESLHYEEIIFKCGNYMEKQKDINEKMRAVVINWIIEVHHRFKLHTETLFLAVNLLDRYLCKKIIKRNKLQLLTVACLLVSCKYEEIFSPEIRDFVCILDKSYEKEDIVAMEKELLRTLKFDVTVATSLKFYEILYHKLLMDKTDFFFGRYLIELALINYKFNSYLPSLIACSACYIALTLFKKDSEKKKNHKNFFKLVNYKQEELMECSMDLCFMYENAENMMYPALKKKFSSKSLMEVAKLKFLQE
jgi:G2/mitotic-specific cyclin-B, other